MVLTAPSVDLAYAVCKVEGKVLTSDDHVDPWSVSI